MKTVGDSKGLWPNFLYAALFTIRITTSRATGFSPYYLLYGTHPVLSFDVTESTWQTLDWDKVSSTSDLLALRIRQLQRRDPKLEEASNKLKSTRRKAIEDFAKRHHFQFDFSAYEPGMWVWLRESQLENLIGDKAHWTYSGPYIVHEKLHNDAFILQELDGTLMRGHVNIRRLRLFFFRPDNQTLRTRIPSNPAQPPRNVNPTFRADIARRISITDDFI
ncbi:hypothetical protein K435DRAFT_693342 [Dendrothele bispora CBS 962.96]|uniref:Uncharacterized protein n=1 Tax=Dendrothele bispora (strain CBS 962.96) TaxID=1314807 RepID=A0A4S8KZJ3_DENBC|nr:hypothetical protein K435DRAFT_693342 [Dendrothele bispora CBS 962.96]